MKKCKYCMSEIDKKAKICPNCHKSQTNKLVKFLIYIIVFFVIIFILISACSKGISDAIDETTNQKEKLKLEENTVVDSKDEYGIAYYIEGYIKNESDKNFSYVQVTYTAYDKDGNTLGTCLDNNSGLEANGRWKFKATCLSDVENIASYKLTEITGW